MNAIGIALVWCVLQVTLACAAGAVVYLVARKTRWAAGRMATIASLALVFTLSVTVLSPWPSWFSSGHGESDSAATINGIGAKQHISQGKGLSNADVVAAEQLMQPASSGPLNMAFWQSVWAEMQYDQTSTDKADALANSTWRWPAMVAVVFLGAVVVGILRLLIAWLAVRRLNQQSTTIHDSRLTHLAATISDDLSLSCPIALKESSELQSAATFGWRHPVILLPKVWRDWPTEELRAVLAHELAHIRTGDFLTWLFAQLAVAMHFYHPLVHWLAGRLRLEQELAADATAAQFAGGRETYLQSLATLTLRADHLRPSWATQTFLPTRSMFIRRIEMLKQTKAMTPEKLNGKVRLAVVSVLVAIGLLAGGLRAPGPIGTTQLVAAEPATEKTDLGQNKKVEGYDFAYVPEKFLGMLAIRPADLAKSTQLAPLVELLGENIRPSVPIDAAEQITLVMPMPRKTKEGHLVPYSGTEYTIFRTNRAVDFKSRLEPGYGAIKTEQHQSQEYWTWGSARPGLIAFHSPDDKTLLSTPKSMLFEVMDNPQAAEPPTAAVAWQEQATGPIFGIANVKAFRELQGNKLPGGPALQMFAPIFNHVGQATFSINVQGEPTLKIQANCTDLQQVPAVEQTVRSALVLLDNMVASQLQALENKSSDEIQATKKLLLLAAESIKNAKLTSDGNSLSLTVPLGDVQTILQVTLPALQAARAAAKRTQRANNLKQIAIAMLNYESVNGHYPPAVLYDEETGTPYSWRVAILPYMEQQALYDQYRFDQPWDSEHNMKIAETVVPTFSNPNEPASTNSAYFTLVGPETAFAGKEGVQIQHIVDGTANTLLVVEAKRDIPWTKPEDIPYASDKPLPKLGGFSEQGFNAAFCDGSARFMSGDIAQETLRHLIEKADGNVIDRSAF